MQKRIHCIWAFGPAIKEAVGPRVSRSSWGYLDPRPFSLRPIRFEDLCNSPDSPSIHFTPKSLDCPLRPKPPEIVAPFPSYDGALAPSPGHPCFLLCDEAPAPPLRTWLTSLRLFAYLLLFAVRKLLLCAINYCYSCRLTIPLPFKRYLTSSIKARKVGLQEPVVFPRCRFLAQVLPLH